MFWAPLAHRFQFGNFMLQRFPPSPLALQRLAVVVQERIGFSEFALDATQAILIIHPLLIRII